MKISDTPFLFFGTALSILASPPFLWEKSEPIPFFNTFENSATPSPNPTSFYKGGGVQLCFSFSKLRK